MLVSNFCISASKLNAKLFAANLVKYRLSHFKKRVGAPDINRISSVEIDNGRFKYLLFSIKIDPELQTTEKSKTKTILRGFSDCRWHMNIYERVRDSCEMLGFKLKCMGGGEIYHDAKTKQMKIWGTSEKYGKADHCLTKNMLLKKFPDYRIIICDRFI